MSQYAISSFDDMRYISLLMRAERLEKVMKTYLVLDFFGLLTFILPFWPTAIIASFFRSISLMAWFIFNFSGHTDDKNTKTGFFGQISCFEINFL